MARGGIRPNSGRGSGVHEWKVQRFKDLAWDRIIKQCETNENKLDYYIELFSSKLIPQTETDDRKDEDKKIILLEQKLVFLTQIINGVNTTRVNLPANIQGTLQDTRGETVLIDERSMSNLSDNLRENSI